MSAWRTVADTYKKAENREIFLKALGLLSAKPEELRDWAIESQDRQWDFSKFLEAPFLQDNEGRYISISDYLFLDTESRKIVHIHLHNRLMVGRKFLSWRIKVKVRKKGGLECKGIFLKLEKVKKY